MTQIHGHSHIQNEKKPVCIITFLLFLNSISFLILFSNNETVLRRTNLFELIKIWVTFKFFPRNMTLKKIWLIYLIYLTYKYSDHSWVELVWGWWGRYHPWPPISSQYFLWFQISIRFISIDFQIVDLKRLAGSIRFNFGPFLSWLQRLGHWLFQTLSRTSFMSTFIWWEKWISIWWFHFLE